MLISFEYELTYDFVVYMLIPLKIKPRIIDFEKVISTFDFTTISVVVKNSKLNDLKD